MKKIFMSLVLTLAVLLLSQATVTATDSDNSKSRQYSEVPTIGVPAPDLANTSVRFTKKGYARISVESADLLQAADTAGTIVLWGNDIVKVSSTQMKGYGETICNINVDEVGYTIYFQRWDGYSWVNFSSTTNTAYTANSCYSWHYKNVSSGYYYRLAVYHRMKDKGIEESTYSESAYILVN